LRGERVFKPRPSQEEILRYAGGRMGVSAVPGSGKTHILSYLAARLVAGSIDQDQEVLIVTMVNSAVDNFASRIADFIQREAGLLPNIGYRVRTLHGLAHDIVRERPGLLGLEEDFGIVDEREAARILADIVQGWLGAHPQMLEAYISAEIEENRRSWVARQLWPELAQGLANAYIRRAKDLRLTSTKLRESLGGSVVEFPLAQLGLEAYEQYQRVLSYRGAVDFDDLIVLALQALEADADLLARLRRQWPFILEDEAQDSSQLQQEILELLAGETGNWVRVGDPNQSIHTTFTTANPRYLRDFLAAEGVKAVAMPNSGRSTREIIALANHLVDWATGAHMNETVRDAFQPQHIEPTPPGDPQPNPSGEGRAVFISRAKYSPDAELKAVADSLARWLPEHPDETVAVLAPRNERGFLMANELRERKIPFVELLRSSTPTRLAAGILADVLHYLADPASPAKLARAFEAWQRSQQEEGELDPRALALSKLLSRARQVEDYVWPRLDRDWLAEAGSVIAAGQRDASPSAQHDKSRHSEAPFAEESLSTEQPDASQRTLSMTGANITPEELLLTFRGLAQRWQDAAALPIDQLVLTLAQDLFADPADLALAYKLASTLRQISESNPGYRLAELTEELLVISRNERAFIGFAETDTGFQPPKGVVTIATMHKAKGLEWDRVHLLSINNYDFPSDLPGDSFISERWFVRDGLNLEAEALAQLEALPDPYQGYQEGRATQQARLDYVRERLRLLYVGITRARRDLIITWNTGKGKSPAQPAVPLLALQAYLEGKP
jgi:DNA helicase-2/ATP-dependent DNA helicase PcrA